MTQNQRKVEQFFAEHTFFGLETWYSFDCCNLCHVLLDQALWRYYVFQSHYSSSQIEIIRIPNFNFNKALQINMYVQMLQS